MDDKLLYYTYILRCADDTLYTGYTDNIARRLNVHNAGMGAKYTRGRLPVTLVYARGFPTKGEAMSNEAALKRLKRNEKLRLIASWDGVT